MGNPWAGASCCIVGALLALERGLRRVVFCRETPGHARLDQFRSGHAASLLWPHLGPISRWVLVRYLSLQGSVPRRSFISALSLSLLQRPMPLSIPLPMHHLPWTTQTDRQTDRLDPSAWVRTKSAQSCSGHCAKSGPLLRSN